MITSTRENCLGQECPQFARCHVFDARRTAQAAEIVVVNHHLLLADLALKDEGFGDLLPGAEAVILDEAHQVPDIAAQFFGQTWSVRQVQILLARRRRGTRGGAVRAPSIAGELAIVEARLDDLRGTLPGGAGRYEWGNPTRFFFGRFCLRSRPLLGDLAEDLEGLGAGAGTANCARRAEALATGLGELARVPESFRAALGRGSGQRRVPAVHSLRDCGSVARICRGAAVCVGVHLGDLGHRRGLHAFCRAHWSAAGAHAQIESPFDYRRSSSHLSAAPHAGAAASREFAAKFIAACAPLLEASGGRAFLLYTSYRGLAEGVAALRGAVSRPPFPVLVQGQAPREALLNRFRELGNAVLLATGSFWEGVDVKGEALSIVAIDKLPFAAPDDPLLKARLEGIRRRGGNPFFEYQLPQAVLALKQGVGRLIRDFDDFGIIVLGDPRLNTKGYGKIFLQALPPSPVITDAAAGAQFLTERLGRPRARLHDGHLT